MTTETTITERASRAQTLLQIVNSGLPIPREISFHENGSMDLTLDSYADLQTWSKHVGARVGRDRWTASNGGIITRHDGQWSGWWLTLYAHETAESVAALESTIAPGRVDEILAELNRLSQDPDGNGCEPDWWDWIHDAVPEFDAEATAAASDALALHLTDGTVFVWERQSKAWAVSA